MNCSETLSKSTETLNSAIEKLRRKIMKIIIATAVSAVALHLLKSGKVPCEWSGKKTRCYKIRKEDVKAYLEERSIFPDLYSAPKGWYGTHYMARLSKELPEDTLRQMHGYYEKLLRKYPDVVTVEDVVAPTGYTKTTVHN